MANLMLDLTGKGGLAPRHWGDIDRTVASPNLRYLGGENQMADGVYNPFRRYGYLSPSNGVFNAVTDSSTENFGNVISCVQYDPENDDFYMGVYGGTSIFYQGDGLDDVALTQKSSPVNLVNLFDFEIYQVNGVRKLFYVYNRPPTITLTTTLGSSVAYIEGGAFVISADTSVPTLNSSTRATQASGTTLTQSITVASGTNRVLVVIAANYTATAATAATYNDVAMTLLDTTTNAGRSFTIFYTIAPTVTTANVVVTWPSSQTNQVINALVFHGSDQTTPISLFIADTGTSTSAVMSTNPGKRYVLFFGMTLSATATHTQAAGQTEVFNSTNTSGNDSTSYKTSSTVILEVGIATLPFASATNKWLTGTVSGAFSNLTTGHCFMENADNGFSYLFQDNAVHKIDGTTNGGANGTVTANTLLFPTYFRCVDAVDYRGLMFIGIHQYSSDIRSADDTIDSNVLGVGVYIWDRLTSVVNTRDYIVVSGVKQIRRLYVSPSGKLRMLVINAERVTEIREYTGSTFEVVQEVGFNAYPAFRDSVASFGNSTTWLGRNGYIYAHGKAVPGENEALYKLGQITDISTTTAVSAGAILFGGEDTGTPVSGYKVQKSGLYLSYYDGANYKVKEWDMHGTGATGSTVVTKTAAQGDVYTLVKYLPQMSTVKNLELFMAPGSGSGATTVGTVKIYFNQSTTPWASKAITRDDSAKGYKHIEINKPFINSIQLEVEFAGAVALGTLDFAPSFGVIEYEPTVTKG